MKHSETPISDAERKIINEKCRNRYRLKVGIPLDTPVYETCRRSSYKKFSTTQLITIISKLNKKVDLIKSVLLERRKEEKHEL